MVQDRAAAEDATHESLMAAVAKIDKLRNPEQLQSWLFAITRNRCLTMASERNRFTDAEGALDMIPSMRIPPPGFRDDSRGVGGRGVGGARACGSGRPRAGPASRPGHGRGRARDGIEPADRTGEGLARRRR